MPANENVYRREIYSGQTKRVNYGKRITYGNSTHYTVKSVCYDCASALDEARKRSNRNVLIFFLLVAVAAFIFYISKH